MYYQAPSNPPQPFHSSHSSHFGPISDARSSFAGGRFLVAASRLTPPLLDQRLRAGPRPNLPESAGVRRVGHPRSRAGERPVAGGNTAEINGVSRSRHAAPGGSRTSTSAGRSSTALICRAPPDLQIDFRDGYRTSWQTSLGAIPEGIVVANMKKWSGAHCASDPSDTPGDLFVEPAGGEPPPQHSGYCPDGAENTGCPASGSARWAPFGNLRSRVQAAKLP